MTKKELKKAQIEKYGEYAKLVDIHQKAVKGCHINFGSTGNYAELIIKYSLNNYNWNGISPSRHSDTRKKINGQMCSIEIKTCGGELATIISDEFKLMNGKRTNSEFRNNKFDELPKINNAFKADYVVYIPEPDLSYPLEAQAYVTTGEEFEYIMKTLGLIKYKRTTEAVNQDLDHYDRFAIADFTRSKKMCNALYDMLDEIGIGFLEWKEENEIE